MGETNFHTREIPQSGSKAKVGGEREKERLNDGNNNGQARMAHASRLGQKLLFSKGDQKCLIHPENNYYENNIYQSYPPNLGH